MKIFLSQFSNAMEELNPVYNKIEDLKSRCDALRGYL